MQAKGWVNAIQAMILNIHRHKKIRANRDGAAACLGNIYSEMSDSAAFVFKAMNSGVLGGLFCFVLF